MEILLDTCTFLWIVSDAPELTDNAKVLFHNPDNEIYLSVVSAWEIAVKHSLGKLPLPSVPEIFVPEQRQQHNIETLPLNEDSALLLTNLPDIHRDPFDRMIICQAVKHNLIILTPDALIREYPVKVIW